MNINKIALKTDLLFLLFAFFWGASFPIIQNAIHTINPYLFVFLRFSLATLAILPFALCKPGEQKIHWLKIGLILGIMNTAIYSFETLSLKYTLSSRSAFITGTNVILIPVFASFFRLASLTWIEIVSTILFLFGLYILTGSHFNNINYGDMFALMCAASIALSITYLQYISKNELNPMLLTFYQILFTCPIPFLLYILKPVPQLALTFSTVCEIIFCAIFATALPLLGQIKFQRHTTASQTALIFSLEPVFASLIAYLFFNETITSNIIFGGSIMLISTVLSTVMNSIKKS